MYLVTLYFNGPRTRWSGKLCPEETIACEPVPWLWLAKLRAAILLKPLKNVGAAITDESGEAVHRIESQD